MVWTADFPWSILIKLSLTSSLITIILQNNILMNTIFVNISLLFNGIITKTAFDIHASNIPWTIKNIIFTQHINITTLFSVIFV